MASGGRIVDNDWGRRTTDFLRYKVELPAGHAKVFVALRYARAMSGDAVVDVTDNGDPSPQECGIASTPCPWDCQASPDGDVGINDFLDLLGQWTQVGTSCDFDGGGVGINDFLDLLAAWGPNPGHPADLDGDGVVGINDFLMLLANCGPCP